MNKVKTGKIAGKSYDDFLEAKGKDLSDEPSPKAYSNKLIAFLDLLGIKDLINKYKDGNEHKAIDTLENMRKIVTDSCNYFKMTNDGIDYIIISDSFVFICEPKAISSLITLVATVQTRAMTECHFQLRGAITIGDAIVQEDGKFIIGPAYIKAFLLQEKSANYPRVIIDNSVIEYLSKIGIELEMFLDQDADKEYFVDYIEVYMRFEYIKKKADMKIKLRTEGVLKHIANEYNDYCKKDNHNISQKYGWTIQYFKNIGVWENVC